MPQDLHPTRRRPFRRRTSRRLAPGLLVVLFAVVVLGAGCNQSNTPTAYDDTTESNFIQGCTGDGVTDTTLASEQTCQCAYDWVKTHVPYDDANKETPTTGQDFSGYDGPTFKAINDDLSKNPDNLPDSIKSGLESACAKAGWKTTSGTVPLAPS